MSTPAEHFETYTNPTDFFSRRPANAASLIPLADTLALVPKTISLASFKYKTDTHDHKWQDYFVLGLISILVHTTVVKQFDQLSLSEPVIEAVKIPPKVQITLSRPQAKPIAPPPQVQSKPPVPKVVPLKPQKTKPVEKIVEPSPAPVIETAKVDPNPAPVAPSAPVVEEKITAPVAGADYLHNPAPEYPEIAMERGWEGKVLMKVHVKPDGKPDEVSVLKSSGQKILDDAAVKTVNKWSFVPAMRGTTPIAGWVTVPISFNLS